jgi:hypothetical protein
MGLSEGQEGVRIEGRNGKEGKGGGGSHGGREGIGTHKQKGTGWLVEIVLSDLSKRRKKTMEGERRVFKYKLEDLPSLFSNPKPAKETLNHLNNH